MQGQLRGAAARPSFSHIPRDALLHRLQNYGRRALRRFTDEQVDMFGHRYIPDQSEFVTFTDSSQRVQELVSRAYAVQQGQATITTKGQEMQVPAAVVTLEILGHGKGERAHT